MTKHSCCGGGSCSTMQKTTLQPLSDRVLLRRLPKEESVGSILLPENAQQKQEQAEVIAIGPGKLDKQGAHQPMPVQPGQKVLIEKYSGQEVKLDDQDFVMVRASEIIAIIE